MNLGRIMTRGVVTVDVDDTLRVVKQIFDSSFFHHLVVTERGRAVGVISDRDLLRNLSPFAGKFSERPVDLACLNRRVHQVMSRKIVSAQESTPIACAARLLIDHRISCLPILDERGHCVGIVTWYDLLRWAFDAAGSMGTQTEAA